MLIEVLDLVKEIPGHHYCQKGKRGCSDMFVQNIFNDCPSCTEFGRHLAAMQEASIDGLIVIATFPLFGILFLSLDRQRGVRRDSQNNVSAQ